MKKNTTIYYMAISLILLTLSFGSQSGTIQVGSRFTYQGELQDNGVPVNGVYDLSFKLFEQANGGTAIGPTLGRIRTVTNGLFSVELDFGDAVFNGDVLYLEISVSIQNVSGTSLLSPRQRINATPYAVQAEFVANGSGSSQWDDISGGIGYSDDVKIGNTSTATSSMLTVDADAGQSPIRFKVNGATRMIIQSNGGTSIGVNTTAPTNGLRVEGITRLYGNTELKNDLKQDSDKNGAIKAAVTLLCSNNPSISSSFNGVDNQAITVSVGNDPGVCGINFPFPLTNRYYVAMYKSASTAILERRLVTCNHASGGSTLACVVTNNSGTAVNSEINVLVY